MIENLRESFKEMITDLDWMEDKTKMFAKDKVMKHKTNVSLNWMEDKFKMY